MMPLPIASSSDDFMSIEEASSFPLSLNSIQKKQTSNMPARVARFLFFIFTSLLSLHKISAQTAERERQILIEIKGAWLNPDPLRSWNLTGDHCQFAGIHCSADGFVQEINLPSSSISFPIPASICHLKRLTFLNLSNNSIGGGFPVALYNCSNLQKLDISNNFFVGELPADMEKLPINLTHLIICGNNFTGDIPSAIGRLPSIVSLQLSYNLFNGTIPAEIGNLSTLQSLMLAHNPFAPAKILPQIGNLTSLTYLWMSNMNLLGEIPGTFGKLSRLEHLDLSMNSLAEEIPPSIWMIKPLKNLYLYANRLTGEISSSIAANALIKIDLSKNKISGSIPEAFAELKSLSHLFLYYNNFSGELPLGIGRLTNLYDLRLFNNRLEGALPPEIGKHSRLWNFEVDDNMFTGGLPEHLCDGKALTCLIAFNNRLTGRFPESLGRCGTLLSVHVQNNSLTGEFPAGIWSAINLSQVIVSHNALRGTLPEELPWYLTLLDIQNNQFTGRIPSKAGNLAVFYADHNEFTGELPVGMPLIQQMSLSGNQISGEIPAGIGSLKFLSVLNLSSNLLSGRIPDAMGSMPVLNSLDLSKNKLSGEIPSSLGALKLTYLNLSVNGLAGEIPPKFQNLAYEKSFLENPNLCSSSRSFPSTRICREIPSNRLKALILALVSVLIALIFLGAVCLFILVTKERRRRRKGNDFPSEWKLTSFQTLIFDESLIFNKLTDENLVGEGGGGKVYRVCLSGGTTVAVKKIFSTGKAGTALNQQFQTEAEILGCIRHTNIVKLLCCLSSENLKLLVYEYLPKGSLDLWLHRRRRRCGAAYLDWPTRVRIAVSSARGLCYMHHGCSLPIIHRDVKSSNILLDLEFNAKIADFGLARILEKGGGEGDSVSRVAGSYGYMAPECRSLGRVNEKVDVYSFGVVLLELVTGKEAGDGGEEEDENLTDWAWKRYKDGGVVVDEEIAEDSLGEAEIMFGMGIMCTGWDPARRPTMKMVLQVLMKLGASGGDGEKPLLGSEMGSRRKKVMDGMEDSDNGRVEPCSSLDSLL